MLSRVVLLWHKAILRRMRRKPTGSKPWMVRLKWHLPLEMFNCLRVVAQLETCGGHVVKNTKNVEELHITELNKLACLFSTLANKYKKSLDEDGILLKREKDESYSNIIASESHPVSLKYSKTQEMLTITARYGHFNRLGVPQYTLEWNCWLFIFCLLFL